MLFLYVQVESIMLCFKGVEKLYDIAKDSNWCTKEKKVDLSWGNKKR